MSACYVDRAGVWRRVERKMLDFGYSYRQLAALLGVTPSMLSRLKGGRMIDADALVTICAWLGVGLGEMTVCEWTDGGIVTDRDGVPGVRWPGERRVAAA